MRAGSGGKWQCDGCRAVLPLKVEPAEILHGQTSEGGTSISFCGSCALERKKNMAFMQRLPVHLRNMKSA